VMRSDPAQVSLSPQRLVSSSTGAR
jgi:hypothetical protein